MSKRVKLLPHQLKALKSRKEEVLLLGGIASGKTLLGAQWVVSKIAEHPNCTIMVAANTYQQLMNASIKTLTNYLDELDIEYKAVLSGSRKRIEIGNATIIMYSLEKYENIRGVELEFIWLDEVAFSNLEALNVIRGRLRGKHSDYRQILMTTSSNGYNFLYDIFGNIKDTTVKQLISAKTSDNTFLPEGYYDMLVDNYGGEDSPLAQQELFGKFVNLQEGAVYSLFDRDINLQVCELRKEFPVYVGVDYNIDQMSATYMQYIGGVFYQCDEVQLTHRNANTFDLGQRIIKDLNDYEVFIVPDSTGRARKSSGSGKSDHQIMRDMGLRVMETRNPLIRDRQNNMNVKFKKKMLFINPKCVKTIKEIETLSRRDTEGKVSHLSVTTGYVCWKLDPLKLKAKKFKQLDI